MSHRRTLAAAAALPLALTLTSCVENAANADSIEVTSDADTCAVSTDSTESGARTFKINNTGNQVTEFYLLADDGLHAVK